MLPGDLIDLAATCPPACVTYGEDGGAWALVRTQRKPRVEGKVPYRVVGPVDDPDSFDITAPPAIPLPPEPEGVALVRKVFEGTEVVGYDRARLCHAVSELLAHYGVRQPEVFEHTAWQELAEAEDGPDDRLVAAAEAVVSWCRTKSPDRLRRDGWQAITCLLADYRG